MKLKIRGCGVAALFLSNQVSVRRVNSKQWMLMRSFIMIDLLVSDLMFNKAIFVIFAVLCSLVGFLVILLRLLKS